MSAVPLIISCPYCRRQYTMKLDRAEIERDKRRATCGRCGNSFELASRIVVPGSTRLAPSATGLPRGAGQRPMKAPTHDPRATSSPEIPAMPAKAEPAADLDDLTREIMAAADSISQKGVAAPMDELAPPIPAPLAPPPDAADASLDDMPPAPSSEAKIDPPSDPIDDRTTNEYPAQAIGRIATPLPPDPPASPMGEIEVTSPSLVAVPPAPAGEAASHDWIAVADPGLVGLTAPRSASCLALDRVLT